MRDFMKLLVVGLAAFALAFAACDSGNGTSGGTEDVPADEGPSGGDADAGPMEDEGGGDPDVPIDPCDPNPCQVKPDDCTGVDETVATTYTVPGACTDDGGGKFSCDYAVAATDDCAAKTDPPYLCRNGACVENPPEFTPPQAAWINWLAIAGAESVVKVDGDDNPIMEPECCFDFGSADGPEPDGTVDNALGALIGGLAPLLGEVNVNEELWGAIKGDEAAEEQGSVNVLFGFEGLDEYPDDADFQMSGYLGAGNDYYDTIILGDSTFAIDPLSFEEGTKVPLISFATAAVAGGLLEAGPAVFALSFPLGEINLQAQVSGTRIEIQTAAGDATGAAGPGLKSTADGKLGGYVLMPDLFDALNGFMAGSCACLGVDGPLIVAEENVDDAKYDVTCADTSGSTCDPDVDEICTTVAQYCTLAGAVLGQAGDLDLNVDGIREGMSIGLWFSLVSANICGELGDATACPDIVEQ